MPTSELITTQLDAGQLASMVSQLQSVLNTITLVSQNLSKTERQKYAKISEQNKLLVGKVREYQVTQPLLCSADVNWTLFSQNWNSRTGFAQIENLCETIVELASNARILHDYSLYKNTIGDYNFAKYKAESSPNGGAFQVKVEDIKQFFPNPGGINGAHDENDTDNTDTATA